MDYNEIRIGSYAEDTVLVAENEDDLQRLLHEINIITEKMNMKNPQKKLK